jgi:hypothetical protein
MVQKEFVISLSDLRYVSITCPNCRTIVTLDMKEPSEFSEKHGAFAPKECPGCRIDYDTAIRPAVDGFQRSYQSLGEIADRISFRSVPVTPSTA